jgi:hypothetical protein
MQNKTLHIAALGVFIYHLTQVPSHPELAIVYALVFGGAYAIIALYQLFGKVRR